MAKAQGAHKQAKVSKHSRAARRETSPSIDTDKSLKQAQPPSENKTLNIHHGAGITKRKAKGKRLSRTQRLRHEKGMARAEAVMDQMENKMAHSTKKAKTIKGRRTDWEDINKAAGDHARSRKTLDTAIAEEDDDEWEDADDVVADENEILKEEASVENARAVKKEEPPGNGHEVKQEDEVEVW